VFVIIGFVVVLVSVLGGFAEAGGPFLVLIQPAEFMIIGGAAAGALMASAPKSVLQQMVSKTIGAMKGATVTKVTYLSVLKLLYELLFMAQKEGLIALEKHIETPAESAIFSKYGDILQLETYRRAFGRIAAQTAKHVVLQKVQEAERTIVFNEYKDRKGELVTGVARRFEKGNVIVDLGKAEAILPFKEQCPRESYRAGDRVQAYVKDVTRDPKGHQVILSRTDPRFVVKLFEKEVPEIYEGIVYIGKLIPQLVAGGLIIWAGFALIAGKKKEIEVNSEVNRNAKEEVKADDNEN
jgi:hypothetical protein